MMKRFEEINDDGELCEFLRDLYSRYNKKDTIILSHYSSIYSILNILNSGSLWLGDYRRMNDSFENEVLNRNQYARNFYFSCFSQSDESLAMYKMYGGSEPESTVVLQLSLETFLEILSYSYHKEHVGGIDDDGKYPQYQRKLNIVREGCETNEEVYASLYGVEIAYLDPLSGDMIFEGSINSNLISPLKSKELVGMIKYKCWEYEKEMRLCAFTSNPLEENESLALKLPKDICKKINIVLGPGFDIRRHMDSLVELSILGVQWKNSVYSAFYTNITKGYVGTIDISNKVYIENYLNNTFCGKDPWGDNLSLQINGYKNGFIQWKWINDVSEGDLIHRIELDEVSYLEKNLVFHFSIYRRLHDFEDQNEFFEYSYNGVILLSDNRVIVSFNSGSCCNYVFGGGGADNYEYGGTGRNALNQMVILDNIVAKEIIRNNGAESSFE